MSQCVEHLDNVTKYCIVMLRYCYNIVRNPLFIVLMKFPSSATAGLRPVQPLRCCFLASSSLPAVLEGYPSIPWQSVMSVMASEGSNAVFSYQAARRPVQRDRPQRPALGRPAIVRLAAGSRRSIETVASGHCRNVADHRMNASGLILRSGDHGNVACSS